MGVETLTEAVDLSVSITDCRFEPLPACYDKLNQLIDSVLLDSLESRHWSLVI